MPYDHDHDNEVMLFAETNFRNERRRFGIKTDDRRRHMYIIGKTGMGKTTLLENLVLQDIQNGHGVALVDPHGDFAEKILDFIPPHRVNDVVYCNPADMDYPIGFNVLEAVDERHKHLVAGGLMGVFKKIWPDVWSPRMEYILNNCILALLECPGSTLMGINRLMVDKEFRRRVIAQLKDPVVKAFWMQEYAAWEPRFRNEAIAPIQNKVGQFLSTTIIRNIVAQVRSTFDPREIMDNGKIFIMNLAKGRVGEDASRLLGGMLITKFQLAAMERVDMPERERKDFYLYVDEFQNFATESFANILSEARKYRLNLIMAHQYIEQLDEIVQPAVFGNVGTLIFFRVGAADAETVEPELTPQFVIEDLVNLAKYDIYLKLMIDGVASNPFSATTLPPLSNPTGNRDKVIQVSRERYAIPRAEIEEKVLRWSGVGSEEGGIPPHEEGPALPTGGVVIRREEYRPERKSAESPATSFGARPPRVGGQVMSTPRGGQAMSTPRGGQVMSTPRGGQSARPQSSPPTAERGPERPASRERDAGRDRREERRVAPKGVPDPSPTHPDPDKVGIGRRDGAGRAAAAPERRPRERERGSAMGSPQGGGEPPRGSPRPAPRMEFKNTEPVAVVPEAAPISLAEAVKREPVRFKGVGGEAPAAKDRQHGEPAEQIVTAERDPDRSVGTNGKSQMVSGEDRQKTPSPQSEPSRNERREEPKPLRPGERIKFDE